MKLGTRVYWLERLSKLKNRSLQNCAAFLPSDSLVGQNLGELRENEKHKNQAARDASKYDLEKDKVSLLHGTNYMALFLGITTSISDRLLQTKISNIISLGYTIFWNGTKFIWTLPFLHAVSFLPILLSTVSTQGTGNVFLYERSISEYHKDVKNSGVQVL